MHPREFGRSEIRVQPQTCAFGDHVLVTVAAQLRADASRAPVLPHDGLHRCIQGLPIPEHKCFALIGDADGRRRLVSGHRRLTGRQGCSPDLGGVVFDPPLLRKVLRELLISPGHDGGVFRDQQGSYAGRADVNGENAHGPTVAVSEP